MVNSAPASTTTPRTPTRLSSSRGNWTPPRRTSKRRANRNAPQEIARLRAPSFRLEKGEALDSAAITSCTTHLAAPVSSSGEALRSPSNRIAAKTRARTDIAHHSAHLFEVQLAATITASSPSLQFYLPHDSTATELAACVVDECPPPVTSTSSTASCASPSFASSSAWEEEQGLSTIAWRMEVDGTTLEGTLPSNAAVAATFDRRAGCAQPGIEVLLSSVFADLAGEDSGPGEYRMMSTAEIAALDASILACEFDEHVDSPCACFSFSWYTYDPRVAAGFITDDPSEYASSPVQTLYGSVSIVPSQAQ